MFSTRSLLGSVLALTVGWSVPVVYAEDEASRPQIDPYISLFGGIAFSYF